MKSFFHRKEFQLPSIVGKNIQEACIILSNLHLSMRITDQKVDPELPDGTILSQIPHAGQLVKPRQTVFITIACKPGNALAPDFIGKEYETILKEAEAKGIKIQHHYLPSDYPSNTCIGQTPSAGIALSKEGMIIYCAQEKEYLFIWPNFIGKPLVSVLDFLDQYQIIPQIMADQITPLISYQDLIVTDQRPFAGSIITMEKDHIPIVQLFVKRAPSCSDG